MRLLDRESGVVDFQTLGFTDAFMAQFLAVLEQPHGILLVTGPTGSGKTTTLYTATRGSGRVPDRGDQPDPGQAADRSGFFRRTALDRDRKSTRLNSRH